ncbi:MAG: biotin-dependent carboxyltransferase family protein [Chloroflexota bacterium]|nr:biotin-dependent carboxyltransferase family protein [Chloroflexota bacterium]
MMRILVPGLRATIQDRGRRGHVREGIPPSGPADPGAFAAALALAGCPDDQAAIEIVGLPFAFRCDDRRIVVATGRDVRIRTRGRVPGWTSVLARPGEEVVVEGSASTRFAYVAVSGGIAVPMILGSRATYLPAPLGPVPRPLAAGDELPLGESSAGVEGAGRTIAPPDYARAVRAVAGPHDTRFSDDGLATFFSSAFTVLPESDRMGVRLTGLALAPASAELLSCGVVAGAVQVPPGGAPIVLLADHQTTGGYPIIATVLQADLGIVAQSVPGQYLRFERVTPGDADRSA